MAERYSEAALSLSFMGMDRNRWTHEFHGRPLACLEWLGYAFGKKILTS